MALTDIFLIDDLASTEINEAVWRDCNSPNWLFGHGSVSDSPGIPFWYMDLTQSQATTALWQHAKPQCDELTRLDLEVVRQYANGHTFGQGGQAHQDDEREGAYTLLYYPMPEWQESWEGETQYMDTGHNVIGVVRPQPNRGVLFDARIPHFGRAPGRLFAGLRVTVAFKLMAKGSSV